MRSDENIFVSQSLIDQDKKVFFAVLYRAFLELICGNLQGSVGNREKNFTMVNVTSSVKILEQQCLLIFVCVCACAEAFF